MLTIRTDKETCRPGETVLITLTLCNETEETREFQFVNAQRFDICIKRRGEKVWQWSDGRLFAQVMTTIILPPGDSRVFKAEWPQVDAAGRKVPPGEYEIEAWIVRTEERAEARIVLAAQEEETGAAKASSAETETEAVMESSTAETSTVAEHRQEAAATKEPAPDRYRMYYGMWALHGYPAFAPFWLRPPLETEAETDMTPEK